MDDAILPPDETGGVPAVAETGEAERPAQDAAVLARLVWLYEQKFEIEKAIFNLLRFLAPDK